MNIKEFAQIVHFFYVLLIFFTCFVSLAILFLIKEPRMPRKKEWKAKAKKYDRVMAKLDAKDLD